MTFVAESREARDNSPRRVLPMRSVETGHEAEERRLAETGRLRDRVLFTRTEAQRKVGEDPWKIGAITKRHLIDD